MKKVRKGDENCVEKLKKKPNFYAREGEVRSVFFSNKPMILLVYKEAYFNTDDLDHIVPSVAISLLQSLMVCSPIILLALLTKTQMRVKRTMILHLLAKGSGLDQTGLGGM